MNIFNALPVNAACRAASHATVGAAFAALLACSGQPAQAPSEAPRPVLVEEVDLSAMAGTRIFAGELRAADRTQLSFEVGGVVADMLVDLGDRFKAGDVLARLDARTLRYELDARRADLIDAEAGFADAKLDYDRKASLKGSGAISDAAVDQAKARLDGARARVAALEAQVSSARKRLADARLTAPYDGEVAARLAEPSQVVEIGQPVLRTVGSADGYEAFFHAPQTDRLALRKGTKATIIVSALDRRLSGEVVEIGADANGVGLYPITARITEGDLTNLSPGMSVDAVLVGEATGAAPLIPLTSFVAAANDRASVFVVNLETNILSVRMVTLDSISDSGAFVRDGLKEGDVIVVKGVNFLHKGDVVEPVAAGFGVARYND